MSKNVAILGGNGRIGLQLTRLLASATPKHQITSIVEHLNNESTIREIGATPVLLTLENSSVAEFASVFEGKDVVYFVTGAPQGADDATYKAQDYEGSLRVYDALEAVKGPKPLFIALSAVDTRDTEKEPPAHYNEEDINMSKELRKLLPAYFHWRYEADKALVKRDAFKWIIVRAGGFKEGAGVGTAQIGRTGIMAEIPRDDVAKALYLLLDRGDAAGLAIDVVGGETNIAEGLDAAIKKHETDFPG
ncbi:hypothetical protein AX16_004930 [Volvariella volvacea WC 439]|nr:hypothetical protein AX16_004930 [Volvariella volvacea WC 439]